jgi:outer membrane lipoprotein
MKTAKALSMVCMLSVSMFFAGCTSYAISKKYRQEAIQNVSIPMVQKAPQQYTGKIVIWGGRILDLTYDSAGSQLTVLESPLHDDEYPMASRYSRGRFIAATSQFLDSAVFQRGHKVTLAGEITGVKTDKFGNGTYTYPEVKIDELRFWASSPDYLAYYQNYPNWGYGLPYYDFYNDFFWDDFHHGYIWRGGRWQHREEFLHHERAREMEHHGEGERR